MSGQDFYLEAKNQLNSLLRSFPHKAIPKIEIDLKDIKLGSIYFVINGKSDNKSSDITPYTGQQLKSKWHRLSYNRYSKHSGLPPNYFLVRLPDDTALAAKETKICQKT